ncbi:GNAT family N-acetyltransferase [Chondrinema litorale]|uniref:GNAT family N-acetyltransferase n=1 Tax=Chondrinema litorale TaxID=2994555 RepID=UPI0025436D40|nr:N-acetyltransferase [Chondrinema litorale]UZR97512.1 N-acetyltransferase [Chondrinema litorale]
MKIVIRQEISEDHKAVFELIEKAFKDEAYSDHTEQFLVERLRKSKAFVPALSILTEVDNKIVGHILLTKVKIKNGDEEFDSLALAPVSVLPDYQRKGVGKKLIEQAHQKAKELGFQSVLVLGHEEYYPKFGYQQANNFGIKFPFDVPAKNCMAIELIQNGLSGVSGTVEYPVEFSS